MKRLLVIFNLLIPLCCYADFVSIDLTEQNIPIDEAVSHFDEWFEIGNSEFVLFFDETDELGFRDQDYQQYINGVKVENCALYVHSYSGYVTLINGDIMPIQSKPDKKSQVSVQEAQRRAKVSADTEAEHIFIHETKPNGDIFYEVYKMSNDTAIIYIDIITGEIVRSLPLAYGATSCSVITKYNGLKSINCEKDTDGDYLLRNDDMNLRTEFAYLNSTTLPTTRYVYYNASTNWNDRYLTSVTIKAVHNNWWNVLFGDSPDLYIRIKDENGKLLYVSDYKEDCGYNTSFPVTFRISEMVRIPSSGGYKIEIWDKDPTSDTKGTTVTLSSNSLGTHTSGNSSSNSECSWEISQWHPALDVQWGLEKTWNFYHEVFNLSGFDGNNALCRAILHSPIDISNIKAEQKYSIFNYQAISPRNSYAIPGSSISDAYLYFGMGDDACESLVDLNCVTHEYTHLVTAYRPKGQLKYSSESGAINEGYSDVMAVSAEAHLKGNVNWKYGHGVQQYGINEDNNNTLYDYCRNLANPKAGSPAGSQPDTYGKGPWVNPTNTSYDNGGVHVNNSIFTHWFYILCEGKTGINDNQHYYSVSPIGMEKALKIVWRMHRTYLPAQSTFAQARDWAIQSAKDLYPADDNVLKAVTDAWYAVGVGGQYAQMEFPNPGKYIIVATRNKDTDKSWYYMTSDLGTASTKRFQAVNTTVSQLSSIVTSDLEDKYVWELEKDGNNYKLKNGNKYVTWTSGNSANLSESGKSLTFDITENAAKVHFNDGTAERYLSLNANTSNNFFAFYGNTNQITDLYFLPYDEGATPPPVTTCETVPYGETFASSQGDFTIQNVILPSGFTSIWNWDSQYGMVAKCIKNNIKYESESWLISPCIEMPESGSCVLTFKHAAKFFSSTSQMTLWVSADYEDGLPSTATWQQLTIPTYPTGSNWNWYESGEIDLSAYRGQSIHIAFCYTSTASYAPQWEIKDFEIIQDASTPINDVMLEPSARKILRNGQILILRGEKVYTVTGQEVR